MLHRLCALVAIASFTHLSMVGGDLVCATHAQPKAAADVPATSHHGSHGQHAPSNKKAADHTPGLPVCCQIVTACGITMTATSEVEQQVVDGTSHESLLSISRIPRSLSRSPEPPPPRA